MNLASKALLLLVICQQIATISAGCTSRQRNPSDSRYPVTTCTGTDFQMNHEGEAYICRGRSSGGWGVSYNGISCSNSRDPLLATSTQQVGGGYTCYFDCKHHWYKGSAGECVRMRNFNYGSCDGVYKKLSSGVWKKTNGQRQLCVQSNKAGYCGNSADYKINQWPCSMQWGYKSNEWFGDNVEPVACPTPSPTKRPTTKNPTTKRPTTKNPTTKRPTTKNPTSAPTSVKVPGGKGCHTVTDREACCRYTDGRDTRHYRNQPCAPSAEGTQFTSGAVCQPQCWAEGACGSGKFVQPNLAQCSSFDSNSEAAAAIVPGAGGATMDMELELALETMDTRSRGKMRAKSAKYGGGSQKVRKMFQRKNNYREKQSAEKVEIDLSDLIQSSFSPSRKNMFRRKLIQAAMHAILAEAPDKVEAEDIPPLTIEVSKGGFGSKFLARAQEQGRGRVVISRATVKSVSPSAPPADQCVEADIDIASAIDPADVVMEDEGDVAIACDGDVPKTRMTLIGVGTSSQGTDEYDVQCWDGAAWGTSFSKVTDDEFICGGQTFDVQSLTFVPSSLPPISLAVSSLSEDVYIKRSLLAPGLELCFISAAGSARESFAPVACPDSDDVNFYGDLSITVGDGTFTVNLDDTAFTSADGSKYFSVSHTCGC